MTGQSTDLKSASDFSEFFFPSRRPKTHSYRACLSCSLFTIRWLHPLARLDHVDECLPISWEAACGDESAVQSWEAFESPTWGSLGRADMLRLLLFPSRSLSWQDLDRGLCIVNQRLSAQVSDMPPTMWTLSCSVLSSVAPKTERERHQVGMHGPRSTAIRWEPRVVAHGAL